MPYKCSKLVVATALCFTLFTAVASENIYVGDLKLGKASSISQIIKVDVLQDDNGDIKNGKILSHSALIASLNDSQHEVKVNSHETLQISVNKPHDLLLINDSQIEKQSSIIEQDVHEQVQRFEHSDWFIYVKNGEGAPLLKGFNKKSHQNYEITEMPIGYTKFIITNTGHIVTTDGTQLYHLQLILRGEHIRNNDEWQPIKTQFDACEGNISAFAISHFGNKIAIQCTLDMQQPIQQ